MELIYKETINVDDYNALRDAVGWGALCKEQAQQGLDHTSYLISCYDQDHIVGCARVIWDRGYVAYLADVIVMPEYQGMRIGYTMVEKSIEYVRSQLKEGWMIRIVLQAAKGKELFYTKLGFNIRPNDHAGAGMDLVLRK